MIHQIHQLGRGLVIFLLLAASVDQATAQTGSLQTRRSLAPAVFPRWDVSGSLGMLNLSTAEVEGSPWHAWDQKLAYRADVGRYWTTHFRTELAVDTSNRWEDYDVTPYPAPGVTAPLFAYTQVEHRLTSVAPAITWQFRENTFMHPYVSGGVKVGILQEHRVRTPDLYRFGGQGVAIPPLDERSTSVLTRPFLAGGFKSYISRSAFVRTEARVAGAPTGIGQVSLVAGVGVDF